MVIKKRIITIITLTLMPFALFSQASSIMKMMNKGEYDKVLPKIEETYGKDTLNKDRLNLLYNYYISDKNIDRDSLVALSYAQQYNKIDKKNPISTSELAKSDLSYVYKSKDIQRINFYISITEDYPTLNKEARRIRDQWAYEQVKQSNDIKQYEDFVKNYPDALQVDEAKQWLNETVMDKIIHSGNIDSLKVFASTTTSDTFRKKALDEIDRLSFKKALQTNTVEAYNDYIASFPKGAYVKIAQNKKQSAQYDQYVNNGNITDLIYFLDNNKGNENYQNVFEKLKLEAMEHLSLKAMKKVQEINPDNEYLTRFAKKYTSDLSLSSINRLVDSFPEMKSESFIIDNEKKAKTIEQLLNKERLTSEDYKKNKSLFFNLHSHQTMLLFKRFLALSEQSQNKKNIIFNLNNDIHYLQFKNAQAQDLNFVLTDAVEGDEEVRPTKEETGLDLPNDARYSKDKKAIVFSMADDNGFDTEEGAKNKDIYVSLYKDNKWQKPFAMAYPLNSRFNETFPVLSPNEKMIWFSSDRDLNFGRLDIYVSYREDVNDWNSWSSPILLSEDFNTIDNDYVIRVEDSLVVLTQDETMKKDNDVYLSGNTSLNIVSGKLKDNNNNPIQCKVIIVNKEDYSTINMVNTNEMAFMLSFHQKNLIIYCQRKTIIFLFFQIPRTLFII
jgi:hypothetical protein